MNDEAMAALGLLFAESMLEEAQEIEHWTWATVPDQTSFEDATAATERRMHAQDTVNLARRQCGHVPEEK